MSFTGDQSALILALGATFCFSTASVFFTRYTRLTSALWMNAFKALVCWTALVFVLFIFKLWTPPTTPAAAAFTLSGIIGLGIGDIFLLTAFTRIGAARTLMLFGFQPVLVGLAAAILFDQSVEPLRLLAIVFFILCLFILSFERYKQEGHWEILGLSLALAGVVLDNCAVILTRWGFNHSPGMTPLAANFFRTSGALVFFGLLSFVRPFYFSQTLRTLPTKDQIGTALAAFFGTFLSLALYLTALQKGHLASIAAIGLTGPLMSACFECISERKRPSPYLLLGIASMMTGMLIFFKTPSL